MYKNNRFSSLAFICDNDSDPTIVPKIPATKGFIIKVYFF